MLIYLFIPFTKHGAPSAYGKALQSHIGSSSEKFYWIPRSGLWKYSDTHSTNSASWEDFDGQSGHSVASPFAQIAPHFCREDRISKGYIESLVRIWSWFDNWIDDYVFWWLWFVIHFANELTEIRMPHVNRVFVEHVLWFRSETFCIVNVVRENKI